MLNLFQVLSTMFNLALLFFSSGFVVLFARYCSKYGKEALIAWIALQSVLANIFVLKQINLVGLNSTASEVFAIGSIIGLNFLQAQHGAKAARQAVWIAFMCMFFFCVMSQVHLLYIPSDLDTRHHAYSQLLSSAPRILFASLSVYFFIQHLSVALFSYCKKKFARIPLSLIILSCLLITQFLDTFLFGFLGLYGLVDKIDEVILVSFGIKMLVILISVPFVELSSLLNYPSKNEVAS